MKVEVKIFEAAGVRYEYQLSPDAPPNGRAHRAEELWAAGAVRIVNLDEGEFRVHSQANGAWYDAHRHLLNPEERWCSCADFERHPEHLCKHLGAVELFLRRGKPRMKLTTIRTTEASAHLVEPEPSLEAEVTALFG